MGERIFGVEQNNEESNALTQGRLQDGSSGVRSEPKPVSLIQDVHKMRNYWLELAVLHERFAIHVEEQTALIAQHHNRHAEKKGEMTGSRDEMEVPGLEQLEMDIAKELMSKGTFEFSDESPNLKRQSPDVHGQREFSGAHSDTMKPPSHLGGGSATPTMCLRPLSPGRGYPMSTHMNATPPPLGVSSHSEAHGLGPETRAVPTERLPSSAWTTAH